MKQSPSEAPAGGPLPSPPRPRRPVVRAAALAVGLGVVAMLGSEERSLLRWTGFGEGGGASPAYDAEAEWDEEDAEMHRLLSEIGQVPMEDDEVMQSIPEWLLHAGEEGYPSAEEAMAPHIAKALSAPHPQPDVKPYTIVDLVRGATNFLDDYAVVVYDNEADDFLMLYTDNQIKKKSFGKLQHSFRIFKNMLRRAFPERFCGPECPEFAVAISSGDYPHLNKKCIWQWPKMNKHCVMTSPVMVFGSAFRRPEMYPGMIVMPMPVAQGLHCFGEWSYKHTVCKQFRPKKTKSMRRGGMLSFGDESLAWEDLKPQLVWRGTDFNYLGKILQGKFNFYRRMGVPDELKDVEDPAERKAAGVAAMRGNYHNLLPRWQGVVLTAEAERDAEEGGEELPWADMKFAGAAAKKGTAWYDEFAEFGVPALGGRMTREELAAYRYQIDLGGGGGTTWTGTMEKLAMPGLLFHHVTPTKDYIHDRMTPWVHYVPVKADLSDLKEKYDWAESHPDAARRIAREGTELMRGMTTEEGFGQMYEEDFVEPCRRVLGAYRPASEVFGGKTWRQALAATRHLPGIVYIN